MHSTGLRVRAIIAVVALSALAGPVVPARAGGDLWTGSWAASAQGPNPFPGPDWSGEGFADQTVRQVVRVSTGGAAVRLGLSNVYGSQPLRVTGGTVARTTRGAGVLPGSMRPLTFGSRDEFVVPAGTERFSDPVPLPVAPLEELTVTFYFERPTGAAQFHSRANETSYRAAGDHRTDIGGAAFDATSESWYYLAGVDVVRASAGSSVVTFGDSITDGHGSTPGANNRYPDELAERLVAAGRPVGVLNSGIDGNRLLHGSECFGEKAPARFRRDVLDQPGVRTVIILEGINDIGSSNSDSRCFDPNPPVTAEQLIGSHRDLIRRAHAAGIKVIGGTLLPYEGADYYTRHGESVRQEVNEWIRTSGEYDAVVDFDRALADPSDPLRMAPAYDSGDNLHPNDAGYRVMAEAIDLRLLGTRWGPQRGG